MLKAYSGVCVVCLVLGGLGACSGPAASPTSVITPTVVRGNVPPTATLFVSNSGGERRAPTLEPTAMPSPLPTVTTVPSATALPSPTIPQPSATVVAQATVTRPAASPTPNLPAAVYVTSLAVNPPEPKSKPAQFFFEVAFLNTVGENVNYPSWRVLIFKQGETKPTGDPQGESRTIATGATKLNSRSWEINVVSACESYRAEPVWVDEAGRQTAFPKPDGTTAVLEFQVCPTAS